MSDKLKFEGKFAVGDYIRAYDFEPMRGRPDRFIEGVIVREERDMCLFYVVKVEHDGINGVQGLRVGMDILVPMETSMDYDHRIFAL